MIIHKRYCRKCRENTNHRELKKDFFQCMTCGFESIGNHKIDEEDIDYKEKSYYLYIDGEYIYFNDILGAITTTKEEIQKLLNGDVLRIPMFRVKN